MLWKTRGTKRHYQVLNWNYMKFKLFKYNSVETVYNTSGRELMYRIYKELKASKYQNAIQPNPYTEQ